jgi:hypothetical protein
VCPDIELAEASSTRRREADGSMPNFIENFRFCVIKCIYNKREQSMLNNLIASDKYIRITDKAHFVGNEETRLYYKELVLQREFMHQERVADLRKKHPNLTAIRCMVSETDCDWCNQKYGNFASNQVLRYNLGNPSVVPGVHQWVSVELCNRYFTPWYYVGVCDSDSIYKICYAVNSLGDNSVSTATYNKEFNNMLNFLDGSHELIENKISFWANEVKSRQCALIKQSQTMEN